jgi:hypothetical protein
MCNPASKMAARQVVAIKKRQLLISLKREFVTVHAMKANGEVEV